MFIPEILMSARAIDNNIEIIGAITDEENR